MPDPIRVQLPPVTLKEGEEITQTLAIEFVQTITVEDAVVVPPVDPPPVDPPPVDPPPDPEPTPGPGPSGIPIPTVAKPGWKFAGRTDFDQDIALGSWTKDENNVVQPRPDAARDGQYRDSSGRGIYSAKKGISQHDSLLDCRLFQDANGQRYMGAPIQVLPAQQNIRISFAMKVDGPEAGWKIAPLTSVNGSNVSTRGEYDIPEGQLGPTGEPSGYIHVKGGAQTRYKLPKKNNVPAIYEWHTYTTEVEGGEVVRMYFDGALLGQRTDNITTELVRWVGQHETLLAASPIPAKMGEAHVFYDWIVVEVPA
jgi:hypothetical protein